MARRFERNEIYESRKKFLDKETIKSMWFAYVNMSMQGELSANSYIASEAKKWGVDKEKLRMCVRQQGKLQIQSPEKVLHYHRTSLENADKILQQGYLLNRENIQKNGGDISHFVGSSSANVQFTVDRYDKEGILQSSGFDFNVTNIGAISSDVVFVMSPEILKEDTYDCAAKYPTVEKANIRNCCAAILANNPKTLEKLQNILQKLQLNIPTMLQEEFNRESILKGLQMNKRMQQETGKNMNEKLTKTYKETGLRKASNTKDKNEHIIDDEGR